MTVVRVSAPSVTALWLAAALTQALAAQAPPSTRHLTDLNWMEVGELVPEQTVTVLLPVGTLEAHGVAPNGSDIIVPDSMALRMASALDALVAPTINYGVNTGLDEFPGTFGIPAEVLRETAEAVIRGLHASGFRNIIVLNGHGPNFEPLNQAARDVFKTTDARVLVINWWSVTPDITEAIFETQGGHAGNNETAAILALRPDLVHEDRYEGEGQTTPFTSGVQAWPFPSSIGLYAPGQGFPDFDQEKAARYFDLVIARMLEISRDIIDKWDRAGL